MKKNQYRVVASLAFTLALLIMLWSGCKKKKDADPRKTIYELVAKDVPGVTGTVSFTEKNNTETVIELALTGVSGADHPAYIHNYSAAETGDVVISLNPVDASGKSTTTVSRQDNNEPVDYSDLIAFDGCINVHESTSNFATILAQGDIGGNKLSDTSKTYNLYEAGGSGISGTALFEKRLNGNSLVTISLSGVISGGNHPAHIHVGPVTNVGYIGITLNEVNGITGKSATTIRKLDDASAISYWQLLNYDGYLDIHQSAPSLPAYNVIICRGNIGRN